MAIKQLFITVFLLIIGSVHAYGQPPTPPDTLDYESPLEHEVVYNASDSIRFDLKQQKVYLYGNASIDYDKIHLEGAYISYDFDAEEAIAHGVTDSTGKVIGKPIFREGETEVKADTFKYNFGTKRGVIKKVRTEEGGGYLLSDVTKKQANDHVHVKNGHYTTCDLEHPHYSFKLGKAIVIPNDKIMARDINLQVAEIPTPVWLPFGYFPNKKGEAAGILIPTYGESPALGFFLLNGGYYWPIGDKLDTRVTGDIYSRGSWGLKNLTNYKVRYRFNGSLSLSYSVLKRSDPEYPDYSRSNEFFVRWSHNQDPKARPNSTFNADVNAGTSTNFQNNFNSNLNDYLTNTFQSNINYTRIFPGKPYVFTAALRHNQNTRQRNVNLTLPELAFNVSRFYPGTTLRRWLDNGTGSSTKKWYEKVGVTFSSNYRNELNVGDSVIALNNLNNLADSMRMGVRHNMAVTTTLQSKNIPITLTPTFNATERWYFETVNKYWDNDLQALVADTIKGFDRNLEWNASATLSSKLYGFYTYANGVKVRHVLTPNLSFTYRPDFGTTEYIYTNLDNPVAYSPYELGIYGVPVSGESGLVSLGLINNIEAKLRARKDTANEWKKVSIIDNLSFNTSYDLFKDDNQWSNVRINGRTRLFKKLNVNFSATYDPYDYDTTGVRIDNSYWSTANGLGDISSGFIALSTSLRSRNANVENRQSTAGSPRELAVINANPEAYVDFNVPWTLTTSYNLRFNRIRTGGVDSLALVQTVNFSGDFSLTEKWKIGFSSGYDFINQGFTNNTSLNIYRDLHCWEMTFSYIPFGFQQSYNIQVNVKSAMLQDLKLARRRSWYDNQL